VTGIINVFKAAAISKQLLLPAQQLLLSQQLLFKPHSKLVPKRPARPQLELQLEPQLAMLLDPPAWTPKSKLVESFTLVLQLISVSCKVPVLLSSRADLDRSHRRTR
jgi:hypothetical protein